MLKNFLSTKYFILSSAFLSLLSCSSKETNPLAFTPPDLHKAKELKVTEISKIEKESTGYIDIAVKDSLIVATGSDFEYTQHLFSKNSGEYLASIASMGRGPGEFITGLTYIHFTTGNDSTYYIVHNPMSTVYTCRFKDILTNTLPIKFTRLCQPPGKFTGQLSFTDIIPVNDRIIATPANKRINRNLFELYDINGNLLDTFAVYPQIDEIKEKKLISEGMFMYARMTARPDGKRLVIGTNFGAYMGIYSLENDTISLLSENRYHIPKLYMKLYSKGGYIINQHDSNITGFTSFTSSQDKIYAVYYGRKFSLSDRLYYLLEYDWNGKLLKSHKFGSTIFDITYNPDDNRVYFLYGNSSKGDYRIGYMEQ